MKKMKSRFLKDGLALVSGNVWAQAIAFAAYLLFARLYSPEDFGLYNIFYSYIEVLVIVSTCKYELAIVLGRNDREAMTVGNLAMRLNTVFSLALLVAIVALCVVNSLFHVGFLAAFSFQPTSFVVLVLVPIMVYFCGTSRVYTMLLNRLRQFRPIALSDVVGSTSGVLAKLLMGLPQLAATLWHGVGLPLGTVLGRVAGNVNLRLRSRGLQLHTSVSRAERREVARRFRNFPLFTMPKELVNSLSYNLPFLWLALYFDKAEVGLFSLALTFTFRPVNILNSAFEKLLYVRVTEKVRNGESIKADLHRFVKYLNIVALPLFVVGFIFADGIFGLLFGGRWSGCGFYIRCLLPWVYVMLTSTSLMFLSNVFARQRTEFVFYIVLFILRVAAMLAGIVSSSFRLAIMLFAISGAAVSLALLVWQATLVSRYEKQELIF